MRGQRELWDQAVGFTREKSPATFDQWFCGVQFDGLTEGVLSLRARDEFVREWVHEHFVPTLSDFIASRSGLSVQVAWTIDVLLDKPVVDRPVTPSVRMRALNVGAEDGSPVSTNGAHSNGAHHPAPPQKSEGPSSTRSAGNSGHMVAVAPPIEGLNPKYTFSNFVIGPSNQLAHAAAIAAAGGGGPRHNPLFLCGGTGLGKTHLVHAVAYRVRAERPTARIVYISAERFVNEFVQALQDQKMNEFRARFRERCDLLLVDDIQFLANKTQTQE